MGSRLRGSKRGCGRALHGLSVSPAAAITLTLILSQDGRGDKRDGYDGYAKVSRTGEVRGDGFPLSRENGSGGEKMGSRLRGSKRGERGRREEGTPPSQSSPVEETFA